MKAGMLNNGGGSKHELMNWKDSVHALYNYVMPASCACDDSASLSKDSSDTKYGTAIFLPLL